MADEKDLITKEKEVLDKLGKNPDLEKMFEVLVPDSGPAETVAGELVRAMMKIEYRYFNDGDLFYSGYEIGDIAAAASFLIKFKGGGDNEFSNILREAKRAKAKNDNYEYYMKEAEDNLVAYIIKNPSLLVQPNKEDMLSTSTDKIIKESETMAKKLDGVEDQLIAIATKSLVSSDDISDDEADKILNKVNQYNGEHPRNESADINKESEATAKKLDGEKDESVVTTTNDKKHILKVTYQPYERYEQTAPRRLTIKAASEKSLLIGLADKLSLNIDADEIREDNNFNIQKYIDEIEDGNGDGCDWISRLSINGKVYIDEVGEDEDQEITVDESWTEEEVEDARKDSDVNIHGKGRGEWKDIDNAPIGSWIVIYNNEALEDIGDYNIYLYSPDQKEDALEDFDDYNYGRLIMTKVSPTEWQAASKRLISKNNVKAIFKIKKLSKLSLEDENEEGTFNGVHYGYWFRIYPLDEDGDELDAFDDGFDDLNKAIAFAKKQKEPTHIVCIPNVDPDEGPEAQEWWEENSKYDPYEVVWESNKADESLDEKFSDSFPDWFKDRLGKESNYGTVASSLNAKNIDLNKAEAVDTKGVTVGPFTSEETKKYSSELNDFCKQKDPDAYFETYWDVDFNHHNEPVISVDINWGDWKHEHLWFDELARQFFESKNIEIKIDTNVTEEDGSDTYSATHVIHKVGPSVTELTGDDANNDAIMVKAKDTTAPVNEDNETNTSKDNYSKSLSPEQISFFKNSKIKNKQGQLIRCFHSTNSSFNTFNLDTNPTNGNMFGNGFYFSINDEDIYAYGTKYKEVYLDIKNPYIYGDIKTLLSKLKIEFNEKEMMSSYGIKDDADIMDKYYTDFAKACKQAGYDGIIIGDIKNNSHADIVAFYPNQIKSINNLNPTQKDNINESLNWKEAFEHFLFSYFWNSGDNGGMPIGRSFIFPNGKFLGVQPKKGSSPYEPGHWSGTNK